MKETTGFEKLIFDLYDQSGIGYTPTKEDVEAIRKQYNDDYKKFTSDFYQQAQIGYKLTDDDFKTIESTYGLSKPKQQPQSYYFMQDAAKIPNEPKEQDFPERSWNENISEGWKAGVENLKGGLKYLGGVVGETLDKLDGEDDIQWDNRLMESARKNFEAAPQGKGIWYELGSFAPQMIGIAAAAAASPLTGGTSLAAIPSIIGGANIAMLIGSAAGSAMNEYDQYKEQKGQESNDLARIGVGIASGSAEYLAERIGLDRYMPKGSMSRAFTRFLSRNDDIAENIAKQAVKKNPTIAKDFLRKTAKNALEEGTEESITEAGNILIETIYKDREDYETFENIVSRMGSAFRGGAMMGGVLSPVTYTADRAYKQKMHFEKDGVKYIATEKDKEGNIVADELHDNFIPTGNKRVFKPGENVNSEQPTDPNQPVTPTYSPTVPTIDPVETVKAQLQQFAESRKHESGNMVFANHEKLGPVLIQQGQIENGKFMDPDGLIVYYDKNGNPQPTDKSMFSGDVRIIPPDQFRDERIQRFFAEQERQKLANQQSFEYNGQRFVDTGQRDDKGNAIIVPLDENNQQVEQQPVIIPQEQLEQLQQAKQAKTEAQDKGKPEPEVRAATFGRTEYQYTRNEDGTVNVLIPNKITPDNALKEIQKHFENNPDYTAQAITEEKEIPAKDEFSRPTIQKVVTGVQIVPKALATLQQEQKAKGQPKYTFGKDAIDRELAAELINQADNVSQVEGLKVENDPELKQLFMQKFPPKAPKYTIDGQEATPAQVKAKIILGKDLDKISVENDDAIAAQLKEAKKKQPKNFTEIEKSGQELLGRVKAATEIQLGTKTAADELFDKGQAADDEIKKTIDQARQNDPDYDGKVINGLLDDIKRYNNLSDTQKGKFPLMNLIRKATLHGLKVQGTGYGKMYELATAEGKPIKTKVKLESDKQAVENHPKFEDYSPEYQETANRFMQLPENILRGINYEVPMSISEIRKAIRDIQEGKQSEAAVKFLDNLNVIHNSGQVYYKPVPGIYEGGLVPLEDVFQTEINEELTPDELEAAGQISDELGEALFNGDVLSEITDEELRGIFPEYFDSYEPVIQEENEQGPTNNEGKENIGDQEAESPGVIRPVVSGTTGQEEVGIEAKRANLLYDALDEKSKEKIDLIRKKYGEERAIRETFKIAEGKTPKANRLVEIFRAEDTLESETSTPLERTAARYSLETNYPFTYAAISDIQKSVTETLPRQWERRIQEIYKEELERVKQNTQSNETVNTSTDQPQQQPDDNAPKQAEIKKEEKKVEQNPSDAQKEAGNYPKGHIKVQGFDITIENPKGSTRSGTDQSGKKWSQVMNNTYGYFKRTKGKDGDQIDVFIGPAPETGKIFVVDQVIEGKFDEHKVMLGFNTAEQATDAYLDNYEEGWQGLGKITEVSLEDFKTWLKDGTRTRKPFAAQTLRNKLNALPTADISNVELTPLGKGIWNIGDVLTHISGDKFIIKEIGRTADGDKELYRAESEDGAVIRVTADSENIVSVEKGTPVEQAIDNAKKEGSTNYAGITDTSTLDFALSENKDNEILQNKQDGKKEPWQMTSQEWFDYKYSQLSQKARTAIQNKERGYASVEEIREQTDGEHKRNIQQALSEGREVPAEVLKDYPDLKPVRSNKEYLKKDNEKGDLLSSNGYSFYNNNNSHGQDGILIKDNLYMVADGVSSNKNSKALVDDILVELSKGDPTDIEYFKGVVKDVTARHKDAALTLSVVKRNDDGTYSYINIGDAVIYVFAKDGSERLVIGENPNNITHAITTGSRTGLTDVKEIRTGKLSIADGESIIVSSDGFADVLAATRGKYSINDTYTYIEYVESVLDVYNEFDGDFNALAKELNIKDDKLAAVVLGSASSNRNFLIDILTKAPDFFYEASQYVKSDDYSYVIITDKFKKDKPVQATPMENKLNELAEGRKQEQAPVEAKPEAVTPQKGDKIAFNLDGNKERVLPFEEFRLMPDNKLIVDWFGMKTLSPDQYKILRNGETVKDYGKSEVKPKTGEIDQPGKPKFLDDAIEQAAKQNQEVKAVISKVQSLLENNKGADMPAPISTLNEFKKEFADPVKTPINTIKVAESVFNKILGRGRTNISGAIKPTLENPDFILKDTDGSFLFVKIFNKGKEKSYNVVAVNKDGIFDGYLSSLHIKSDNNILNKIKNGATLHHVSKETLFDEPEGSNNLTPISDTKDIKNPVQDITTENEFEVIDESANENEQVDSEGDIINDNEESETLEKLQDFGEKIGAARKDTAQRGYKMSPSNIPAWAKKFTISQNVNTNLWSISLPQGTWFKKLADGFKTREEAYEALPLIAVSMNHRVYSDKDGKYGIYRKWSSGKQWEIKGEFESRDDAMKYMAENAIDIINARTPVIDRPHLETISRKRKDWRDGKNVTPQQFLGQFGFRGGEFGNWLAADERQSVLNMAYDAFMDMSEILGISPRALSLKGELSIGFGSRGHGLQGAAAHYEPVRTVINLTRINGAGSLAHEWFHALDNYLAKLDGKSKSERQPDGTFKQEERKIAYFSHGESLSPKTKVRDELLTAFKEVMKEITTREVVKDYDIPRLEKQLQSAINEFESRINEVRNTGYRAITKKRDYGSKKNPATPEQLKQFDELVEKIRKGEYGEDKWHQSQRSRLKGKWMYETESQLSDLVTSIIGKAPTIGYGNDNTGFLYSTINRIKRANQELEKAKEVGKYATRIKSMFQNEADEMDKSRSGSYWSTPHEMAARAFEAFLEDETLRSGESQYLVYGARNVFYRMLGVKPYPEGQERVQINNAFRNLFDTIQEKEEDGRTVLFRTISENEGFEELSAVQSNSVPVVPIQNLIKQKYNEFLTNTRANDQSLLSEFKRKQLSVIQATNPMMDEIHTGVRTINDINTAQEAFSESIDNNEDAYPDFTVEDMQDALESGKIEVYSSKPIKNGTFVTPSRMEAEAYSGDGKVYSKTVSITDIAWIDQFEGQYAKVNFPASKVLKRTVEQQYADIDNTLSTSTDSGEKIKAVTEAVDALNRDFGKPSNVKIVGTDADLIKQLESDGLSGVGLKALKDDYRTWKESKAYIPAVHWNGTTYFVAERATSLLNLAESWLHENSHAIIRNEFSVSELREIGNEIGHETLNRYVPKLEHTLPTARKVDEAISYAISNLLNNYTLEEITAGDVDISNLHVPLQDAVKRVLKRFSEYEKGYNQTGNRRQRTEDSRQYAEQGSSQPAQSQTGQPGADRQGSNDTGSKTPLERLTDSLYNSLRRKIIGESGAKNLDAAEESNIRMKDLEVAKEMDQAGKDAKTIRLATGWEKGAEGKWKYEIQDGRLSVNIEQIKRNIGDEYAMNEVYDSPELYKAYPELNNFKIIFYEQNRNTLDQAYVDIPGKTLYVGISNRINDQSADKSIHKGWAYDGNSVRSKILHETQHIIQSFEGFDTGTNPETALEGLINDKIQEFNQKGWFQDAEPGIIREIAKDYVFRDDNSGTYDEAVIGYEAYQRASGEVEARNVEARAGLTTTQRRNTTLQETEDVPREQQTVRFLDERLESGSYMPEKISVNGVERHTRNSNGQLIHPTRRGIENFWKWFSDSEKAKRIDKLRNSPPVSLSYSTIKPLKEFRSESFEKAKNSRGEYINNDTGRKIEINRNSLREVSFHSFNEVDAASLLFIPEFIENAIFIEGNIKPEKTIKQDIKSFDYFVLGAKINGEDYTVRITVANKVNGESYYDHGLTKIEKGKLLSIGRITNTLTTQELPLSDIKDKRLIDILQVKSSKVVDNQGRPLVVYHGTRADFDVFDNNAERSMLIHAPEAKGFYFTSYPTNAGGYSGYKEGSSIVPVYLSIKNPYKIDSGNKHTIVYPEIYNKLIREGYDGIIYDGGKEIVAFSPTQIKSATGNNGNFDANDSGIRYRTVSQGTPLEQAAERNLEAKRDRRNLKQIFDGMIEYYQEKDLPINQMQKSILNAGGKIDDNTDAYKAKKRAPGRLQYLVDRYLNDKFKPIGKIISKIEKAGISRSNIVPYIIAKHAPERNASIRNDRLKEYSDKLYRQLDLWIETTSPTDAEIDAKKDEVDAKIDKMQSELAGMDFSGILPWTQKDDGTNPYEGRPDDLARDIIDEFESKVGDLANELLEAIKPATNAVLDAQVNSRLISAEMADEYRKRWKNYVPLRGWLDDAAKTFNYVPGAGLGVTMKHAEGRRSMAENPLAYMINMAHRAYEEQVDNEIKETLLLMVAKNMNPGTKDLFRVKRAYFYKDGIDPDTGDYLWRISTEKPDQELIDSGDAKIESFSEHLRLRAYPNALQHEVVVRTKDGTFVVVFPNNPEVAQAFNNSNYMYRTLFGGDKADVRNENKFAETKIRFPGLGFMSVRDFTNFMKGMFTQFNITFVVSNLPRDLQESSIDSFILDNDITGVATNLRKSVSYVNRYMKGKKISGPIGDELVSFFENGGTTGHTRKQTPEEYKEYIDREINRYTSKGIASNTKKGIADWITRWNQRFEDGVRFAVYLNARSKGYSQKESAFRSRNATVDFNVRGKASPWLGTIWGFFEVSMNSLAKNSRYFTGSNLFNGKKTTKRAIKVATAYATIGFLEAMLNDWADDDDEDRDYYNRSAWMRHNYLNIPVGGSNKYISIPLSQFWRGFKAFGAVVYDYGWGQRGKLSEGKALGQIASNFIGGLSPIDFGSAFAGDTFRPESPFIPTFARPFYELSVNRDYRGNKIYMEPFTKEQQETYADSKLHNRNTNVAIKFLTDTMFKYAGGDNKTVIYTDKDGNQKRVPEYMDINPAKVEHIIRGYFGGTWTFFGNVANTINQLSSPEDDMEWRNIPFVSTFIRQTPERKWTDIEKWYENKEAIQDFRIAERVYGGETLKGDKQAQSKYRNTISNAYKQEYRYLIDNYSKMIDITAEKADYEKKNGFDEVVKVMRDANKAIDELNKKHNKK